MFRLRIRQLGINRYLSKPVDEAILISEMMKFLPYHQEYTVETQAIASLHDASDSVKITNGSNLSSEIIPEIISCLSGELMQEWILK